jgi:short-subunit dehydrogenase
LNRDNIVAITGASGGIGAELTAEFIERGFTVIGLDIDQAGLISMGQRFGQKFIAVRTDVSILGQLKTAISEINEQYGTPQIFINNAGRADIRGFVDISQSDFDDLIDLNFRAQVWATRLMLEEMEKLGSGIIVNVASVAGHTPSPGLTSYVASKFALVGFTESLQIELEIRKSSVELILVCPGFVQTDILQAGKQNGFPQELLFMTTTASKCAKKMVEGILNGQKEIYPTANGNALMTLKRLSPGLSKKFARFVVGKKLDLGD